MKTYLSKLYTAAGVLAALSLFSMMVLILAQIIARQFGSHIPSSSDMIGFLVVWSSFLGLAYTMHHQHHIRVELILSRLTHKPQRILNIFVGLLAVIILATFSYYVIALIMESYEFDDMTDGEIALPLWLMQLPMAIGYCLFTMSAMEFTLAQCRDNTQSKLEEL